MAMTLVETVTVGSGGAASIEFTNIPQTGKDLLLLVSTRASLGQQLYIGLNGSTANFTGRRLTGDGSTANSATETTLIGFQGRNTYTANTFGNGQIYISNYASSANKSISADTVNENNATENALNLMATTWANTAAITSIQLTPLATYSFVQYSTVSLYIIS